MKNEKIQSSGYDSYCELIAEDIKDILDYHGVSIRNEPFTAQDLLDYMFKG